MGTIEALVSENARLAEALERERAGAALAREMSSEKVAHLERTVTELTRQSTNDAFQAARWCVAAAAEREPQREPQNVAAFACGRVHCAVPGSARAERG
jgi:hypothetical protein